MRPFTFIASCMLVSKTTTSPILPINEIHLLPAKTYRMNETVILDVYPQGLRNQVDRRGLNVPGLVRGGLTTEFRYEQMIKMERAVLWM
jgi:hypothetical protein